MESRSLPLVVLKGLMDGALLAIARGTDLSAQVEFFRQNLFCFASLHVGGIFPQKTSGDPISLTPSCTNSKAHTKNTGSRCLSKPLVVRRPHRVNR